MRKKDIPIDVKDTKLDWSDLYKSYMLVVELEQTVVASYDLMITQFVNIINKEEALIKEFNGTNAIITETNNEIVSALKLHSVEKKGKLHPFTGPVNTDEPNHSSLFTSCVFTYEGLSEKLTSISKNLSIHLLGRIKEVAKLHNIEFINQK